MKDWRFGGDTFVCLFRAAGVLMRNNKILLQCDSGEYALPGGHVKIGETSEETLLREFREETGAGIACGRLIWVEESFWKWGDKDAHGIVFYYLISLENDTDLPEGGFMSQKDNGNILLEWVAVENLKALPVYPAFIKEKIACVPDHPEHIISMA